MRKNPRSRLLCVVAIAACALAHAVEAQSGPAPGPQPSLSQTGSLAVKGTQGTAGGPSPAGDAVELHLFLGNQDVQQFNAVLDDDGLALFTDIPLTAPLRPLVRIMHAGVVYQDVGSLLGPSKPNASLNVEVYETKLDEPAWNISLRRVLTTPTGAGVAVMEMLVAENPGDYTWLGGELDEREQRTAVSVALPKGAHDVQLVSGFHGWCCTKFNTNNNGLLEIQMPLMPGEASFQYSYKVPAQQGAADIEVASPVTTHALQFMVPDNGVEVHPEGLEAAGVTTTDHGPLRLFERSEQPAQALSGITLVGLTRELPPMTPAPIKNKGLRIGGGIALGVGIAAVLFLLFARKPKPKVKRRRA